MWVFLSCIRTFALSNMFFETDNLIMQMFILVCSQKRTSLATLNAWRYPLFRGLIWRALDPLELKIAKSRWFKTQKISLLIMPQSHCELSFSVRDSGYWRRLILEVVSCHSRGKENVAKHTLTLKVSIQIYYESLAKASHTATLTMEGVENKILLRALKERVLEHLWNRTFGKSFNEYLEQTVA